MCPGPPPLSLSYQGYTSALAKKSFSSRAIALAVVYLLIQFLVPFLVGAGSVFRTLFVRGMNMRFVDASSVRFHQGRLWFLESETVVRIQNSPDPTTHLVSFLFEQEEASPEIEATMEVDSFGIRLASGGDRLYLVDFDQVGILQEGEVDWVPLEEWISLDAKPFFLNGELHGIEDDDEGQRLLRFDGQAWEERCRLHLLPANVKPSGSHEGFQSHQVVVHHGVPHCFSKVKGHLYHRPELPPAEEPFRLEDWNEVGPVSGDWVAVSSEESLAVFDLEERNGPELRIDGLRWIDPTWEPFLSERVGLTFEYGIAGGEDGTFYLLAMGMPGSCTVYKIMDSEFVDKRRWGGHPMFTGQWMGALLLPQMAMVFLPVVFLPLLDLWMKRYRVLEHRSDTESLPYASLVRRACAKSVDLLFVGIPMVLAQLRYFKGISDMDSILDLSASIQGSLWISLAFLWAAASLALLGAMEGRRGYSPGKLLFGIRVFSEHHELCGTKRGVLRNLLFLGDVFFFGGVGLFSVAFTEKWQRIGDLAAKTVVVEAHPTTGKTP